MHNDSIMAGVFPSLMPIPHPAAMDLRLLRSGFLGLLRPNVPLPINLLQVVGPGESQLFKTAERLTRRGISG